MVRLMIDILIGVLGIILSICIKKYKMTSLIADFNPEKHDEEKIAKIVGNNIFLIGLSLIFFSIIGAIAVEYKNIINTIGIISIVALEIKILYGARKYGLK